MLRCSAVSDSEGKVNPGRGAGEKSNRRKPTRGSVLGRHGVKDGFLESEGLLELVQSCNHESSPVTEAEKEGLH